MTSYANHNLSAPTCFCPSVFGSQPSTFRFSPLVYTLNSSFDLACYLSVLLSLFVRMHNLMMSTPHLKGGSMLPVRDDHLERPHTLMMAVRRLPKGFASSH